MKTCSGDLEKSEENLKTRSMDARARAELEKEMGRSKQLSSEIQGINQDIDDSEEERHDVEEQLKQLGKRLDLLAGQGGIENRAKLTTETRLFKENEAQCLSRISEIFGEDGFLMLTPALAKKGIGNLETGAGPRPTKPIFPTECSKGTTSRLAGTATLFNPPPDRYPNPFLPTTTAKTNRGVRGASREKRYLSVGHGPSTTDHGTDWHPTVLNEEQPKSC